MMELVIKTDSDKGRSFRAALLSYATCPRFVEGGEVRPIWCVIACSEAESLPFVRNLQAGRKATLFASTGYKDDKKAFECLKSRDYEYHCQRHTEGSVWTVFLPDLYRIDAGMVDPEGVSFALRPDPKWLAPPSEETAQWLLGIYGKPAPDEWSRKYVAEENANRIDTLRYVTRVASLFCAAYLDRRTRCPLIPEPRFYALVMAAMLDKGFATLAQADRYGKAEWGHGGFEYREVGDVALAPGIACSVQHSSLEALLAECVQTYEGRAVAQRMAA